MKNREYMRFRVKNQIIFVFIIVLIIFINIGCKITYNMSRISDEIYELQKLKFGENTKINELKYFRDRGKLLEKLGMSIKDTGDTLYILEKRGAQGGYSYASWTRTDSVFCNDYDGKLTQKSPFSYYKRKLISEWDIKKIKEAEEYSSDFYPRPIIYATRIIFKGNLYNIDCIFFKDIIIEPSFW
ncbi:hypothetical protein [Coprobacter tertius]|uniref:Uncharacterized protein n=1 Tax=Coprobacter tertius TaxID=2944915 RepID=A0ABT1MEM4_9BACT|nr:hypothetical protein [Coprobacter tertius]MCP9610509.1 hypothetical protein [Coprobacter tertius]